MTPALIITPHPVTLQGQRVLDAAEAGFNVGDTLAAVLARVDHQIVPGQQWVVEIDGIVVPEQHWHLVRPKQGYLIEARRVPEKDVLRIVAIAALSYFTIGTGVAGVGGGLGTGGLFSATGAIGGGSMVGETALWDAVVHVRETTGEGLCSAIFLPPS